MASLQFTARFLCLSSIAFLLISPSNSLTCTSQTFTNNKLYTNCSDLPTLTAYLHWTYDTSNSSLSIAFVATPVTSSGWVAWAINPTGTGMAGAQSLIAFKKSDGSVIINTYNISSYSSIVKSKLSFDVSDIGAESSGGEIIIFATLALPAGTTSVNQIWQVGASVTSGAPDKHEFKPENLNAKGTLDLVSASNNVAPAPAPTPTPPPPSAVPPPAVPPPTPGSNGSVSRVGCVNFVFVILFIASSVIYF